MTKTYYVNKILDALCIKAEIRQKNPVSNVVETIPVMIHDVSVYVGLVHYVNGGIRVEVHFAIPENGVMANTYIEHVGKAAGLKKNQGGRYFSGPNYRTYADSLLKKETTVYSPWNNRFFVVDSMYYKDNEIDEAVNNVITLAKPFVDHLEEIRKMRFWTVEDAEVKAKAKEIIANADLHETDVDRVEKAHWLEDRNSFIRGWFYPFANRSNGTFDTNIYGVEFAAKGMGIEGSFEFAVACIVLIDKEYIAKAKEACNIRKEIVEQKY